MRGSGNELLMPGIVASTSAISRGEPLRGEHLSIARGGTTATGGFFHLREGRSTNGPLQRLFRCVYPDSRFELDAENRATAQGDLRCSARRRFCPLF
jgi:hypothetical protein